MTASIYIIGLLSLYGICVYSQTTLDFCYICTCEPPPDALVICDRFLPGVNIITKAVRVGNYTLLLRSAFNIYYLYQDRIDALFYKTIIEDYRTAMASIKLDPTPKIQRTVPSTSPTTLELKSTLAKEASLATPQPVEFVTTEIFKQPTLTIYERIIEMQTTTETSTILSSPRGLWFITKNKPTITNKPEYLTPSRINPVTFTTITTLIKRYSSTTTFRSTTKENTTDIKPRESGSLYYTMEQKKKIILIVLLVFFIFCALLFPLKVLIRVIKRRCQVTHARGFNSPIYNNPNLYEVDVAMDEL